MRASQFLKAQLVRGKIQLGPLAPTGLNRIDYLSGTELHSNRQQVGVGQVQEWVSFSLPKLKAKILR